MTACSKLEAYRDGELSSVDRVEFEAHLASCEACRVAVMSWAFVEVELRELDGEKNTALPDFDELSAKRLEAAFTARRKQSSRARVAWFSAAAALLAVASSWFLFVRGAAPEQPRVVVGQVLSAPDDAARSFDVADDHVELGAGASLAVRELQPGTTRLALVAGRVTCTVTKKTAVAPFLVEAGAYTVRVVGTVFSVERSSGETVAVSVSRGAVEVSRGGRRLAMLRAGERREFSSSEDDVAVAASGPQLPSVERTEASSTSTPGASQLSPAPSQPTQDGAKKETVLAAAPPAVDLNAVQKWIVDGRFEEAREALEAHLSTHKSDPRAWSLLAECERRAGRWSRAVDAYGEVIARGSPRDASTALFRAGVLLQEKLARHGDAARMFDAFVAASSGNPLVPEAMLRESKSLSALGDTAKADALLESVARDYPGSAAAIEARRLLGEKNAR